MRKGKRCHQVRGEDRYGGLVALGEKELGGKIKTVAVFWIENKSLREKKKDGKLVEERRDQWYKRTTGVRDVCQLWLFVSLDYTLFVSESKITQVYTGWVFAFFSPTNLFTVGCVLSAFVKTQHTHSGLHAFFKKGRAFDEGRFHVGGSLDVTKGWIDFQCERDFSCRL